MGVEHAVGIALAGDVAAQDHAHFVAAHRLYHGGADGVVRALIVIRDYAERFILVIYPLGAYQFAYIRQATSVAADNSYYRTSPVYYLGKAFNPFERQRFIRARPVHGQNFAAALEMVVREHAAAYAGQRGVAADEVVGKRVYKVAQFQKCAPVDVHGRVFAVYRDAVLVEIAVGRVLPEPFFAVQREVDGAQRALVAHGAALVFAADGALGIAALDRIAARRLFGVAEFGLCLVYGYYQPVFLKAGIFVELALLYVVVFNAVIVKPVGRRLGTLRKLLAERAADIMRRKRESAHNFIGELLFVVRTLNALRGAFGEKLF